MPSLSTATMTNSSSSLVPEMDQTRSTEVSSAKVAASSSSLKRRRPPMIEIPNVLQEIHTVRDLTPPNDVVSFSGIGVAVSSIKGKKKFMEDAHKIVSCSHDCSDRGFFGVYDGHGGRKAADFVTENLHANIYEAIENSAENGAKEEAIKAGYLKTDQEFLKLGGTSGACCVTALIEGQDLVVSNVGDCRAVLCRAGVAETLTTDHRAEKEDERRRIQNKGGYVEFHRGAWRVHGVLSVSRSIGDAHLKDWVLAEPDTKVLHLTPDMDFLVLASDGLWGEVGNQEAVDTVLRFMVGKKSGPIGDFCKDNDEDHHGYVNISPSSKIRRISLVKQPKDEKCRSPLYNKAIDSLKDSGDDFVKESGSPPLKTRKISLVKRMTMKTESPGKENNEFKTKRFASVGVTDACKELVNLAVQRGSLDDITVMIIDLSHFKRNHFN